MSFAENLKLYRKKRGISQTDLAKTLGVGRSTIAMYETGDREPNYETLKNIASVLGVSQSELLGEPSPYFIDSRETFDELGNSSGEEITVTLKDPTPEMLDILDDLATRPDMRMLFKLAHGATEEDLRQAVKIIEALRKE